SQFQNDFSGWEVNADIDFHRYYLALEYGSWSRSFVVEDEAGNKDPRNKYHNDGTYWRVGVDVNFLLKDIDRNMFFLGARYGRSNFSEELDIAAENPFDGPDAPDVLYSWKHIGVNAHWFELTTGLRVKVWKALWMGYTARFKFGLKADETDKIIPTDVPGDRKSVV